MKGETMPLSCKSFFGPPHKWGKWRNNTRFKQQRKCNVCGKLQQRNKRPCSWGIHKWKLDRRTKPPILRCQRCPKDKPAKAR